MEVKQGNYVRDIAGNISKVDCIVDYKRNNPTYYLLSGNLVIISNDDYIDSDIKYGKHEKIINVSDEDNRYTLIEPNDYIFGLRVVGKNNYSIALENGISKYIDLLEDVPIITKEKVEINTILF